MPQQHTLLIFDVDGTLTESAGLTRMAFELAAEELYGVKDSTRGINPHGRTDPLIFAEMLDRSGISCDGFDAEFARFSQCYIVHFERLLAESDKPRLHKGVRELLDRLVAEPGVYLAIGTGNIERGAYLKLQHHGVADYFPVGGFGSDSPERSEVIAIAHRRAERYYGLPFPVDNSWVVGDTPSDIQCSQRLGACTIAVATGTYAVEELARYHPTALFENFEDQDRFIRLILGQSNKTTGQQ